MRRIYPVDITVLSVGDVSWKRTLNRHRRANPTRGRLRNGVCVDGDTLGPGGFEQHTPRLKPIAELTEEVVSGRVEGRQLLAAARERTMWTDELQSLRENRRGTFLYDEAGYAITEENQPTSQPEEPDDLWLVPATALQDSVDDVHEESHQSSVPSKNHMECWECDRETEHRFDEFESLPSADWSGQPIWECRVCGTPRYGLPE